MTSPDNRGGDIPPTPYNPTEVERKWQQRWAERGTNNVDLEHAERPFYALMMFPYPSAEGLHVGNLFAFTGSDISARYHRLTGKQVFQPLGYDAFGIHSENYALKIGAHPMELTPKNVANFQRQLERAALMVDWRHKVNTSQPETSPPPAITATIIQGSSGTRACSNSECSPEASPGR